jgi:hypothetical protein
MVRLYHVDGTYMKHEYGVPVELYWQGKTEVLWQILSQCHFVQQKSKIGSAKIEPGPLQRQAGD